MGIISRKPSKVEKEVGVLSSKAIVKTIKGEEVICGVIREYQPEKGQRVFYFTPFGKYGKAWLNTLHDYEPSTDEADDIVFDD